MASTYYHIDHDTLQTMVGKRVRVLYHPADVNAEGPNGEAMSFDFDDFYCGTLERVFMAKRPTWRGSKTKFASNVHIPGELTACVDVQGRGYRNMTASRIVRIDVLN